MFEKVVGAPTLPQLDTALQIPPALQPSPESRLRNTQSWLQPACHQKVPGDLSKSCGLCPPLFLSTAF